MNVPERILAAGVTLLHEQGLAALTQPRIAKAAGVSQSHLTYYFPTRNELLLAIAEHSVDQALSQQLAKPAADPAQALAAAMRFLPRVRMLLGLVVAADQDPALRDALVRLIAHVRHSIGQLLAHLGYQPEAPQVLVFHAAVVGLAVMHLGRQSPESEQELETGLAQLLALLPHPFLPHPSLPGRSSP
ncbi:MAG: TetR/AcrR family transcriptional regulator [Betaproteobacteria bacterium]|nr:TetR/AcrR family transcriptional regulator [Betaproteobacteria bacterium]